MIKRADLPAVMTGITTTLAGIGVARFAYTPLLPELIQAGWFGDSQAVYLGAANLLGYLIGALSAHRLSEQLPLRALLGICFIAIAMSFMLCAAPASFAWFFVWRLIAGACGAILMVVGPATVLTRTPQERRAVVGAFVFTGIGLGALLSALVVPLLIEVSLTATWLTLGALVLLVGLICDRNLWRLAESSLQTAIRLNRSETQKAGVGLAILLVMAAYAMDAIGFVPHTVFWVDYLAREQHLGTEVASIQWAVFGVGAACGPLLVGWVAQRLGWQHGLTLAFIAKALAVGLPLLSIALVSRTLSSFIVGAMVPGVVALTSGRIAELVGPAEHKRYWGYATAIFAIAQAGSGYAMSALYGVWGSYYFLFYTGSAVLALGAMLIVFSHFMAAKPACTTN
ncbi:YbfB/YjiJ family MFS transporter [Neptuniibacter sp. CAU 1671]|uniref:YbfB/YjiJ family MFS transporter n=1 Tax=Neptuniibacter sp. CAU 1671 TaxID=3032593 RepID=UPI0023DC7795|nr:YbfB/YjiJ family MFS transporter [Neptuniibacter sp. CAU 1671]MDF2182863.1 YbfB/YjiJ family MFS transporter [Neptuniibacter sp. CAU 1671]